MTVETERRIAQLRSASTGQCGDWARDVKDLIAIIDEMSEGIWIEGKRYEESEDSEAIGFSLRRLVPWEDS